MIYTDIVEYNIVGDTKAPLLRCFPFISKLKSGDIITTGQYMNYQTFSNPQFKRLLKNSFHSIHINLRDTSGEKIPFTSVDSLRLPYYKGIGRQRGRGFGALAQFIGRTAIRYLLLQFLGILL